MVKFPRIGPISLRRKILVALWVLLIPLVVVGGLALNSFQGASDAFRRAVLDHRADSLLALRTRDRIITAEYWAMEYVNQGRAKGKPKYLRLARQIDQGFGDLLLESDSEREFGAQAVSAWNRGKTAADSAMELPPGSAETAPDYPLEAFHPAVYDALGALGDVNTASIDEAQNRAEAAEQRQKEQRKQFLVVVGISVAATFVMGRGIKASIHRPLEELEKAADLFGADNLTHRIEVERQDELGRVASAFNAMATKTQELEHRLRHQAFHDSLTDLPNRRLLTDRLERAIDQGSKDDLAIGVIFLDLDDFKTINDTLGHEAGDELLIAVAMRLNSCARSSDIAARLGGDEFAVLLAGMKSAEDAVIVADRIIEVMRMPFLVAGQEMYVTCSMGIAISADRRTSVQSLLSNADVAMYVAKNDGKDGYAIFDAGMHSALVERVYLKAGLGKALEQEELVPQYQPIVELRTNRLAGAEALVRWRHPERGLVPPSDFLPLAEETGQIVDIDRWMLHAACRDAIQFQNDGGRSFKVTVNISGLTLQNSDVAAMVQDALTTSGLTPAALTLEITESALMRDIELAKARLHEVKKIGVNVAIDDFGTGYSSANYLKLFPVDVLKIDKSFIDDIAKGPELSALARAVIQIARSLELEAVAEGIEEPEQAAALIGLGTRFGQGYLFSRPLDRVDMETLVKDEAARKVAGFRA